MERRRNPYAPGAGTPPVELAGRDSVIEDAAIAIDRIRHGRAARSLILYGLRGVGKTVLLNRIANDAEAEGVESVSIEAPEDRSFPAVLVPALRKLLLRLSRRERTAEAARRALRALSGFVSSWKVTYADVDFAIDAEPLRGLADSGDLSADLSDLIAQVGGVAGAADTACVLFVDEVQYIGTEELGAFITALHHAAQKQLPVATVAAGLPQVLAHMGDAKSYAERLFAFVPIEGLPESEAARALTVPAENEGAAWEPDALDFVVKRTQGYPYFLQAFGSATWDLANESPFTLVDAGEAAHLATDELDHSFFRVRYDRLTPAERRYVEALASLGPGAHRSGEIAAELNAKVTTVAPTRSNLIRKGMVYSPAHGDTAFTVPMFDEFVLRTTQSPTPTAKNKAKS